MEHKVLQEKRFSTKKQITKQYYKPHEGDLISFQEVAELIETLQAEAVAHEINKTLKLWCVVLPLINGRQ